MLTTTERAPEAKLSATNTNESPGPPSNVGATSSVASPSSDPIVIDSDDNNTGSPNTRGRTSNTSTANVVTPSKAVLAVKRASEAQKATSSKKKAKTAFILADLDLSSDVKIRATFKEHFPNDNAPVSTIEVLKRLLHLSKVQDLHNILRERHQSTVPTGKKKKSDVVHFLAEQMLREIKDPIHPQQPKIGQKQDNSS